MSIVETVKIEGDTLDFVHEVQKANREVDDLTLGVNKVGNASSRAFLKFSKGADRATKQMIKSQKKVKNLQSSFKNLTSSMKNVALGALAVDKIGQAVMSNQDAVDFFNTSMNRVSGLVTVVSKVLKGEVAPSFDAVSKAMGKVVGDAARLTELEKASNAAEIERQRIQLAGQKNAEIQRQIRDDISRNLTDREKANKRLNFILQKQIVDEQAQVEIQLEFLDLKRQLEFAQANELAYQSKSIELLDIQERVLSQQSEYQTNILGLQQERLDVTNQQTELDAVSLERTGQLFSHFANDSEIVLRDININVTRTARERLKMEAEYYEEAYILRRKAVDSQIAELERQVITETALYKQLLSEKQSLDDAYTDFMQDNTDEFNQIVLEQFLQSLDLAQQAFVAFSNLYLALATNEEKDAERAFKANKALQLANAIVNTASGIVAAYANAVDVASGVAFAKSAIIAASGTAQIATILKTKFQDDYIPSQQSYFSAASQPANFNIVSSSGGNILVESIASQFQKPIKAYVVSGEVISGTELDRRRVRIATFG